MQKEKENISFFVITGSGMPLPKREVNVSKEKLEFAADKILKYGSNYPWQRKGLIINEESIGTLIGLASITPGELDSLEIMVGKPYYLKYAMNSLGLDIPSDFWGDASYKVIVEYDDSKNTQKQVNVPVSGSIMQDIFYSYRHYPWGRCGGKPRGYVITSCGGSKGDIKADSKTIISFDREDMNSFQIKTKDASPESIANNVAKLFNLPIPFK